MSSKNDGRESTRAKGTADRIRGRYQIYKQGTQKVLEWLVDTANQICYIVSLIKSMRPGYTEIKDKINNKTIVTITTREMITLAQAIASSSSTTGFEMPMEILDILQDVIKRRKDFADGYKQLEVDSEDIEVDNLSHQYFIGVLQRVHAILSTMPTKADMNPGGKSKPGGTKKAHLEPCVKPERDTTGISNLYANPQLEEPSLAFETDMPVTDPVTDPVTPVPPSEKIHLRIEKQDRDLAFATWCFLKDMHDVKDFRTSDLERILRGSAFSLLACSGDEFAALHGSTEFDDIANNLGFEIGDSVDEPLAPISPMHAAQTAGLDSVSDIKVKELLCMSAYVSAYQISYYVNYDMLRRELEKYSLERRRAERNEDLKDELERLQKWIQRTKKLFAEFADTDKNIVTQHVQVPSSFSIDFGLTLTRASLLVNDCKLHGGEVGWDGFFKELYHCICHDEGHPRMSFVYATDIYQDLYDLVGYENLGFGVDELRKTLRDVIDLITDPELQFIVKKNTKEGAKEKTNPLEFTKLLPTANYLDDDREVFGGDSNQYWVPAENQRKSWKAHGCSASPLEQKFPVFPGHFMYRLHHRLHFATTINVNYEFAVGAAAYLYRLLASLGLFEREWQDMDFLIAKLSQPGDLFVPKGRQGHLPTKLHDAFLKALGFVNSSRPSKRAVKLPACYGRYGYLDVQRARKVITTSNFEDSLGSMRVGKKGIYTDDKMLEVALQIITNDNQKGNHETHKRSGKHKYDERKSFTPLQLLSTFKQCIITDEPLKNFDYTRFTADCLKLLRAISNTPAFERSFLNVHGDKLDPPKQGTCPAVTIVQTILRECKMMENTGTGSPLGSSPCAQVAAEMLHEYVSHHGSKYRKQAHDRSSGHIPKHLRPSFGAEALRKYGSSEIGKMRDFFPGGRRADELKTIQDLPVNVRFVLGEMHEMARIRPALLRRRSEN
ncbi:hypothetical protein V8F33_010555 [Rhypophila sp. PSN 637]